MSRASSPRLVFLGMPCPTSVPPLAALIDAKFDVRAVVFPRPGESSHPSPIHSLAQSAAIPIIETHRPRADTIAAIAAHHPDVLVVACFPWKLPIPLLTLPSLGCLNLHPSLLPLARGPEPVFWTLRRGERRTGVTLHRMDTGFDTGPILAQTVIDVPDGIRAPDLEHRLADLGARLLVATLPRFVGGNAPTVPQNDALATLAPPPTAADFLVPTNLPARWAFNFIRGVAPRAGPLTLHVAATSAHHPIRDALDYTADGHPAAPVIEERPGLLRVRFRPGVVRLLVDATPPGQVLHPGKNLSVP